MLANTIIHIVLPAGLSLEDGRTLPEETNFMAIGVVTPWYASTDQVRLEGGGFLNKVLDFTLSAQIWQASKNADALTGVIPPLSDAPLDMTEPATRRRALFEHARNNFVAQQAALDTLMRIADLAGTRGSKTLGNFSVTRMEFNHGMGFPKLISELKDECKKWQVVIQSGADVGFGGHARARFAAKGIYDSSDAPSGRLWYTTGMGANHKTVPGWGSGGKPIRYGSPPFTMYRMGREFSNYCSVFPKVIYT